MEVGNLTYNGQCCETLPETFIIEMPEEDPGHLIQRWHPLRILEQAR